MLPDRGIEPALHGADVIGEARLREEVPAGALGDGPADAERVAHRVAEREGGLEDRPDAPPDRHRVEPGQAIRLPPGVTGAPPPKPREVPTVSDRDAEEMRSLVIHRDDHVIVLNKPPGLAVQGGSGTSRHIDGMLDALRFGFDERPRLVHRLDKDTSGLLLIARTGQAARRLGDAFRDRETEKLYWAVGVGTPPRAEGAIALPLACAIATQVPVRTMLGALRRFVL